MKPWLLATRPATLICSWVPVILGGCIASSLGKFSFWPWFVALLSATLIQIGTNFANDVYDYLKGADDEHRLGPTRAVQAGLIAPKHMLYATVFVFVLALLLGIYLVATAGIPILIIGILSILAGYAYTGGPYPLGYNGLGDIFVFVFFGWVAVCGTVYVQTLMVPTIAWYAAIPCGAIATAILVVNNIRDAENDKKVGKRTLAVRYGKSIAKLEYLICMSTTVVVPIILYVFFDKSEIVFICYVALPIVFKCTQNVFHTNDPAVQNKTLKWTAMLLLFFGLPFSVGLLF